MNEHGKIALLVMDVQEGIVDRLDDPAAYLERARHTIVAARRAGVPVFYVIVGFRPGYPEISSRNQGFGALKESGGNRLVQPQPVLETTPDDIVIFKRRVSAFTGSDLEVLLRTHNIDHLVLTGISTSGVVLSTLRQAADMDYRLTVLSDLCSDFDEEVHRVLVEKVFPRQAQVVTSTVWAASLPSLS